MWRNNGNELDNQRDEKRNEEQLRNTKGMNKTIRKISNKLKQNKGNKLDNKKEQKK